MILFIDDEEREIDSFVQELQFEFGQENVIFKSNVDQALTFLKKHKDDIKLVILDNMMPSGENFKVNSPDGMRTGIFFYQKIRPMFPELHIIIFSNVPREMYLLGDPSPSANGEKNIMDQLKQDTMAYYLEKPDYFPYELAGKIKDILS